MILLYYFLTLVSVHSLLLEVLENLLQQAALFLKLSLEAIAILIIAVTTLQKLFSLFRNLELVKHRKNWELVRLDLGLSLALSLEFLLASDIVGTVVSPSWDAILQLGAITGIRTFLNFFLQREVNQLEVKKQHSS